jgi:uncharacterized protein YbcI
MESLDKGKQTEGLLSGADRRRLVEKISWRGPQCFGKGPSHCKVHMVGDVVTVKIFGFLTPLEQLLLQAGDRDLVTEIRRHVLQATIPAWRDDFAEFGLEIVSVTALTDCDRNVRTLIFKTRKA